MNVETTTIGVFGFCYNDCWAASQAFWIATCSDCGVMKTAEEKAAVDWFASGVLSFTVGVILSFEKPCVAILYSEVVA